MVIIMFAYSIAKEMVNIILNILMLHGNHMTSIYKRFDPVRVYNRIADVMLAT